MAYEEIREVEIDEANMLIGEGWDIVGSHVLERRKRLENDVYSAIPASAMVDVIVYVVAKPVKRSGRIPDVTGVTG